MKEQNKKQLITALLLISCFISGYMLFISSTSETRRLLTIAQTDSLIHKELNNFNISDAQIRTSSVTIDSNFSRKTYFVRVPTNFSKTQLHAELNSIFHNYSIETPAKVRFTEDKINIHLLYSGTIIRSISVKTDPDLKRNQQRSSILVSFNTLPEDEYINKLVSLGEPISIVLKIQNPMQAKELRNQLVKRYRHLIFWLQNEEGKDLIKTNPSAALAKLNRLKKILPSAHILKFGSWDINRTKKWQQLISKTNLKFINAENALILSEGMGKASFFERLDDLENNQTYTMAIIAGNAKTIAWLGEKLSELKKAGVNIVAPQTIF